MITILITLGLLALFFYLGRVLRPARPAEWKKIKVDPTGKGPNVDEFHYEIDTNEGLHRFTDHEKGRGKIRAPGTHDYHPSL